MKRININTQQTHFIGCWNLKNNKLCNEITHGYLKIIKICKKRCYWKNIRWEEEFKT